MSEQSESKEGEAKSVRRCGRLIPHEEDSVCVVPIPVGEADHGPGACNSARWWCIEHDMMRVQPWQPCPKCYSERIAKLEHAVENLIDEHAFKAYRTAIEEETQIKSLEPWVSLKEIVRLLCCRPVVLAGYVAAIQGAAALDLGLLKVDLAEHVIGEFRKALDRVKAERIAQVRAEHRKAEEYLQLAPLLLSSWADLKQTFKRSRP